MHGVAQRVEAGQQIHGDTRVGVPDIGDGDAEVFGIGALAVHADATRRGAQMATFDVGHPDVLEFIKVKREDGRLRQFNLSLLITDEFVEAVKQDADWPLSFPMTQAELETERNARIDIFREDILQLENEVFNDKLSHTLSLIIHHNKFI